MTDQPSSPSQEVPEGRPSWVDVALEEYKSLRQESLQAIDRQHRILALGAATSGVLLGIGVKAHSGGLFAAILLTALMPLLAAFVVLLWLGEFERMVRAGAHIAMTLEPRIAEQYPDETHPPLVWEGLLRKQAPGRRRIQRLYPVIFGFIVLSLGLIGAVYGFIGLLEAKHSLAAVVALAADTVVFVWTAWVYSATEARARVVGGERFTQKTLPLAARLFRSGREALELSDKARLENGERSD